MTPKFTRTTIPEKETLGERLTKKRSALGIDIKEAERATKIRAKYIELLEAGDYEKLPPDVYVRGFLKNYAAFLKLDAQKVLRVYLKERGLKETVKKISNPTAKPLRKKPPKVIITPKHLIIGSAILGALSILFYIGWQISILAAPPKLEVTNPKDNSKVTEESLIVEGKTDAGADVFINDVPIGVDPEGNFKEKVSLQDGLNIVKISTKNKLNKTTQISRTILAELAPISSATTPASQDLEMKLDIGPSSNSVFITIDGKELSDKNVLMLPGSSQVLRAKEKIVISATDGGSIRVTLNGKDLGTLGKTGEKITNKTFTKEL